jgi:hypothetical protein
VLSLVYTPLVLPRFYARDCSDDVIVILKPIAVSESGRIKGNGLCPVFPVQLDVRANEDELQGRVCDS